MPSSNHRSLVAASLSLGAETILVTMGYSLRRTHTKLYFDVLHGIREQNPPTQRRNSHGLLSAEFEYSIWLSLVAMASVCFLSRWAKHGVRNTCQDIYDYGEFEEPPEKEHKWEYQILYWWKLANLNIVKAYLEEEDSEQIAAKVTIENGVCMGRRDRIVYRQCVVAHTSSFGE